MSDLTQEDLDSWCNCGNFPFQQCDECKLILQSMEVRDGVINIDVHILKPLVRMNVNVKITRQGSIFGSITDEEAKHQEGTV